MPPVPSSRLSLSQALKHSFLRESIGALIKQSGDLHMSPNGSSTAQMNKLLSLELEAQKIIEQVKIEQEQAVDEHKLSDFNYE